MIVIWGKPFSGNESAAIGALRRFAGFGGADVASAPDVRLIRPHSCTV